MRFFLFDTNDAILYTSLNKKGILTSNPKNGKNWQIDGYTKQNAKHFIRYKRSL